MEKLGIKKDLGQENLCKDRYRTLCETEKSVPFFSQANWLDVVAPSWQVVLAEKNGKIQAALPYFPIRKWGMHILTQPIFTQTLGIWFDMLPDAKSPNKQISQEHKLLNLLISQLPHFDYFYQCFHHRLTNWLPFYWQGFRQTTRYTYLILSIKDLKQVEQNFSRNVKQRIHKKPELHFEVVENGIDLAPCYALLCATFARQKLPPPCSYQMFCDIDATLKQHNQRIILLAYKPNGKLIGFKYITRDYTTAYQLLSGTRQEDSHLQAHTLLTWEAIQYASKVWQVQTFDFEGSMLAGVEPTRRDFGAIQVPYFAIYKYNNRLLKLYHAFIGRL